MVPAFVFVPLAIAIVVFAALFVYVLLRVNNHPPKYVFLAHLFTLLVLHYSPLLRYWPSGQPEHPLLILRMYMMAIILLPTLLFHVGYYFVSQPMRRWLAYVIAVLYACDFLLGLLIFETDLILSGYSIRVNAPLRTLGMAISPHMSWVAAFTFAQPVALLLLLGYTVRASSNVAERARAGRLRVAVWLIGLSLTLNALAFSLTGLPEPWALLAPYVVIPAYLFAVIHGVIVAFNVLRYGLPSAGVLPRANIASATIRAVLVATLGWILFRVDQPSLERGLDAWIAPPLLIGLLVGVVLAYPAPGARKAKLRMALSSPIVGNLAGYVSAIWASIVRGEVNADYVPVVLSQLRTELSSTFVVLARRARESPYGKLVFRSEATISDEAEKGRSDLEKMTVSISGETSLEQVYVENDFASENLKRFVDIAPAPLGASVAVMCPITKLDDWEGLLLLGPATHGGQYQTDEIAVVLDCADAIAAIWTSQWFQQEQQRWVESVLQSNEPAAAPLPTPPPPELPELSVIWIETLGRFNVLVHGAPLEANPFVNRKSRNLLAYLVWAGKSGVSRERLCAHLWPDFDHHRARNALNVTLHHLRRALAPDISRARESRYIAYESGRYVLNAGDGLQIDVVRFAELCAAGQHLLERSDFQQGVETVRRALALYNGEFLSAPELDLPAEVEQTRQGYRLAVESACFSAAERAEANGFGTVAAEFLSRLVAADPWNLEAYRRLSDHYSRNGRADLAKRYLAQMAERESEIFSSPPEGRTQKPVATPPDNKHP